MDYHNQTVDDLGEVDVVGDFKRMAECVRKLGGGNVGFCTTQPHRELSPAERADKWADFVEPKFSPTVVEGLCEIRNVPTAVDRTVSPTKIPRFYSYQYQYALSMVFAVLHCITTSGSYSLQN